MKGQERMSRSLAARTARLGAVANQDAPKGSRQQIPAFVLKAVEESLLSGETHYTVRPGMPELRDRIAQEIIQVGGHRYDPLNKDCVLITNGVSESLFVTLLGLELKGCEKVAWAAAAGQNRMRYLFDFFGLKVMESYELSTGTREVGLVYREREADLKTQAPLVQMIEEQKLPDFLNLGDALAASHDLKLPPYSPRQTLIGGTLNGLPGINVFRIGFLLGPETYMSRIRVWKQALSICSSAPSQRAALTALAAWQEKGK